MKKDRRSALVLIPPKSKWDKIQEIRLKFDEDVYEWMPHIKLLYPFISLEDYPGAKSDILDVCERFSPFKVTLKEVDFFLHKYQTISVWLNPIPNKKIKKLQELLLRTFPECNDVNSFITGYVPHLTVAKFKGTYKIREKIKKVQKLFEEISFIADSICTVEKGVEAGSVYVIKEKFPLGNI
ncbi:MAG: 2'-5' RNA ligase family protein [Promethearchaeia archaeon]